MESCRKNIKVIRDRGDDLSGVTENPAMMGLTHPYCTTRHEQSRTYEVLPKPVLFEIFVQQIKYKFVSDMVSIFVSQIPPSHVLTLYRIFDITTLSSYLSLFIRVDSVIAGLIRQRKKYQNVSKRMSLPVGKNLLRRAKYTKTQVEKRTREGTDETHGGCFYSRH